jgi:hypothetical protein
MRFEEITYVEHPAKDVLNAMIWRLEDMVPFMDNVSGITTEVFETDPEGNIRTERIWQGTSASVPTLLRPFVSKNSLAWRDFATWTPAAYRCDWRIESKHSKYSGCSGLNYFEPDPENPETRCRCVIAGEFVVHGDKLPAVPKFIGLKIAHKLESIILGYMMPNFRQLSVGLGKFLDAEKGRPAALEAPRGEALLAAVTPDFPATAAGSGE